MVKEIWIKVTQHVVEASTKFHKEIHGSENHLLASFSMGCFSWLELLHITFIALIIPFAQLGHGDFSSASTKVLRMVNSLAVDNEAKQTIEALQIELQKTKEKLQAVEELKKQSGM